VLRKRNTEQAPEPAKVQPLPTRLRCWAGHPDEGGTPISDWHPLVALPEGESEAREIPVALPDGWTGAICTHFEVHGIAPVWPLQHRVEPGDWMTMRVRSPSSGR